MNPGSGIPCGWRPVEPADMAALLRVSASIRAMFTRRHCSCGTGPRAAFVDRTLEFFTRFYLQDDILAKVDRAAMMSSLESRAVFLDTIWSTSVPTLPGHFKFRRGRGKYLLRKALQGVVPARVLGRPKKGFGLPLAAWLRDLPDELMDRPVPGVNPAVVQRCWREHREGRHDHRLFLWSCLTLSHWHAGIRRGVEATT